MRLCMTTSSVPVNGSINGRKYNMRLESRLIGMENNKVNSDECNRRRPMPANCRSGMTRNSREGCPENEPRAERGAQRA